MWSNVFVCLFLRHWTPGSGEQWALKDRKQISYLRCFSCLFALRRPAATLWAALLRDPYGVEQRRALAKSQQDTEVLSPTVHKECNPTTIMWVSLEVDRSQVWHGSEKTSRGRQGCSPFWRLWRRLSLLSEATHIPWLKAGSARPF